MTLVNLASPQVNPVAFPSFGAIIREGLVGEYRFNEGAGQRLFDYSGRGNHRQLGSTAGADTNDPTWSAQGLTFATDDYCIMPVPFDVNGDWTVFFVVKHTGNANVEAYWGIGNTTTDTPYIVFFKNGSNNILLQVKTDTGEILTSASTPLPLNQYVFCVLKRQGNVYSLRLADISTRKSFTLAGVLTVNTASIGVQKKIGYAYYLNGETVYYLPYNRATTDAEDTQNYRALRGILAGRGVSL